MDGWMNGWMDGWMGSEGGSVFHQWEFEQSGHDRGLAGSNRSRA
jgi:hypothetical protein